MERRSNRQGAPVMLRIVLFAVLTLALRSTASANMELSCDNGRLCTARGLCISDSQVSKASEICKNRCGSGASVSGLRTSTCALLPPGGGGVAHYFETAWPNPNVVVGWYAIQAIPASSDRDNPDCGTGPKDSRCLQICLTAPDNREITAVKLWMKDSGSHVPLCPDPTGYTYGCDPNGQCWEIPYARNEGAGFSADGRTYCATFKNWAHRRGTCAKLEMHFKPM